MTLPAKAVDMFCGCGGTTLGLKRAGFQVIAGVEIRDEAATTFSLNNPDAELFYDIRYLTPKLLLDTLGLRKGELALLSGCPPCQGFSTMRTLNSRSASRDERNNLLFEFLRMAEGLRPQAILMENVPGLTKNWRFSEAKRKLHSLGYQVSYNIFNSADFGVPQRRKRLVLCAVLGNTPIEIDTPKIKRITVRKTIGHLPPPKLAAHRLHKMHSRHSPAIESRIKSIPRDGGSRKDLGLDAQLSCHRNEKAGFNDVYGRMSWDDVSPTITRYSNNPSKGRFLHPVQNRALSLLEASLLQSFPYRYKFPNSATFTELASMIGEAFPPKMAEIIAKQIRGHLESTRPG